jgi:hypothetical protein
VSNENEFPPYVSTRARIAIYDDLLAAPRIIEVGPAPVLEFIEAIATTTYTEARALGGGLPYTVIREIAENFIHAAFKECTVSLLNRGNTISFSDQGPGIEKKHLVQQPGVSSATAEMKRFIKGVGSGFPVVGEYLRFSRGHLSITDNAVDGTVVTLALEPTEAAFGAQNTADSWRAMHAPTTNSTGTSTLSTLKDPEAMPTPTANDAGKSTLSTRDQQTLLLAAELGAVGPNDLTTRLDVSAPTVSRILKDLERRGLLEPVAHRKRILSNAGLHLLQETGLWTG